MDEKTKQEMEQEIEEVAQKFYQNSKKKDLEEARKFARIYIEELYR